MKRKAGKVLRQYDINETMLLYKITLSDLLAHDKTKLFHCISIFELSTQVVSVYAADGCFHTYVIGYICKSRQMNKLT